MDSVPRIPARKPNFYLLLKTGRFLVLGWAILAFFMNFFYCNELRSHLIGQEFETPKETMADVDVVRDNWSFMHDIQGECLRGQWCPPRLSDY